MPTALFANDDVAADRLHILVADDDRMFSTALSGLLSSLGHSVDTVHDGGLAVMAAARADFDLAFLDVQMPEMGALEAAGPIRSASRGRPIRIVGLSAQADYRESKDAAGLDDFLVKPVRLAELVEVMGRLAAR